MTSAFQGSAGLGDVLFNEAVSARPRKRAPQNTFRILKTFYENREPWAVYWEMALRDWSGGGGKFAGPFDEFPNYYSSGAGIDTTNPSYLQCAYASASTGTPDPTGTLGGVHSVNTPDNGLVWAIGAGDNVALIVETSATDPTPAATDFDPTTGYICSLSFITSNSAAKRIVVGHSDDAAQIVTISGTTSTVAATMDAGTTTELWWMVETPIPSGAGFLVLYQATSTVYTRLTSSTDTAAGTATSFTNVPRGGFALGYFGLRDKPLQRVWTVIPNSTAADSMLTYGSERLGQVNYWAPDGTDRDTLVFNEMPNGISQAVYVRGGIMATDGERVVHHTGVIETNYGIFDEPFATYDTVVPLPQSSTGRYLRVRGFAVLGDDCWARVEMVARTSVFNFFMWWKLDWETGAWHYYGTSGTSADAPTSTPLIVLAAGSHPVSHNTKTVQTIDASANEAWLRQPLPTGENAYFARNQTSVSKSWASVIGFLWTPRWSLPGLAGLPSVCDSIGIKGDISVTDSYVQVFVATNSGIDTYNAPGTTPAAPGVTGAPIASVRFTAGDARYKTRNRWHRDFPGNTEHFIDLLARIDIGGVATGTPLVTELTLRGYTFIDPDRLTTPGAMKRIRA